MKSFLSEVALLIDGEIEITNNGLAIAKLREGTRAARSVMQKLSGVGL